MMMNSEYADKISAQILDAIQAAESDLFPAIAEVSEAREHYMTRDSGLYIRLANGTEINLIVQAMTPAEFEDGDDDGCDYDGCEVCGQISPHSHDEEHERV
jgi:hypothetical protein